MYLKHNWFLFETGMAEWEKLFFWDQKTWVLNIALFELCIIYLLWQTSLFWASENEMFSLNGSQILSHTIFHDFHIWSSLCYLTGLML